MEKRGPESIDGLSTAATLYMEDIVRIHDYPGVSIHVSKFGNDTITIYTSSRCSLDSSKPYSSFLLKEFETSRRCIVSVETRANW